MDACGLQMKITELRLGNVFGKSAEMEMLQRMQRRADQVRIAVQCMAWGHTHMGTWHSTADRAAHAGRAAHGPSASGILCVDECGDARA